MLSIFSYMKIKTTMTYTTTPIRMVKIRNSDYTKCWRGCGGTETPTLLVGLYNGTTAVENTSAVS